MMFPFKSGCLLAAVFLASATVSAGEQLGRIDFPNSGAAAAQPAFNRGVLLLHSFEYDDAREAFREAQEIDADFALAYWGEAMTYNHPLWRQQDRDAALEALARFAPTAAERLEKTPTERERGYLRAVELLYGEGEKSERDRAYSEALGRLAAAHPTDLEARAFHALSILGSAQGVRDFGIYMRAGAVAEEVFAANPRHPGAAHYLIHSYDDPVHAPLGLRAARVYAEIAPAASHAQHMISHIYVALGRWEESVDANIKSFDVSVERRRRKGLDVDALNYHSLHWLEYSYLQLGRFDRARQTLKQMGDFVAASGSDRALWYHAAMRAAWIVETRGAAAPEMVRVDETQVTGAAADLFATGYAAWLAGDVAAAERAASRIEGHHETAAHGPLCEQGSGFLNTSKNDLLVARVLQRSLQSLVELSRGESAAALALLDEATAIEEGLPLEFGPPAIVKPSHELYGEVLLELGRPQAARAQFEHALRRAPRRSLSLSGLATAAAADGEAGVAAKACAELSSIYAEADDAVGRPPACNGANAGDPVTAAASH